MTHKFVQSQETWIHHEGKDIMVIIHGMAHSLRDTYDTVQLQIPTGYERKEMERMKRRLHLLGGTLLLALVGF